MQTLRSIRNRHHFKPFTTTNLFSTTSTTTTTTSTTATSSLVLPPYKNSSVTFSQLNALHSNEIVSSFKEWFSSRKIPIFEQIFDILRSQASNESINSNLRSLNLRLTESLVLQVLNYQKTHPDILSCLKFFDWVGLQPGFHHTGATFNAIFKILSKSKLMSLMLDYLDIYTKQRYTHHIKFYNTLVIGYAVAGKPEIALQLFGKMRFQGVDLDQFGYTVLLNVLVEESHFEAVKMVFDQIKLRGFENAATHSIMVKNLCKQKDLDKAKDYLYNLIGEEKNKLLNGISIGILVDALCMNKQFEKAKILIEDFRDLNIDLFEQVYSIWIRNLIREGKLNNALEFIKDKKIVESYIPDVFRYNSLVYKLLREKRLEEVFDLLIEMKENNVIPDEYTMNATLCFFCKAGLIDIAINLFNSRSESEYELSSVNTMAYNHIINTLISNSSIDEAFRVYSTAINQGKILGKKTFSIITDGLFKEGKFEKLRDLILFTIEKDFILEDSIYSKVISNLCRAQRVVDGYVIQTKLNAKEKVISERSYYNLVLGFNKINRVDISVRLFLEMQEKGYKPNHKLFRSVIICICRNKNPEDKFSTFLERQISINSNEEEGKNVIYNYFIDGTGHAKRSDFAKRVYDSMGKNGIKPNVKSDILLLRSFLKSEKISEAVNFFENLDSERKKNTRIWNLMITGLAKNERIELSLKFFWEMKKLEMRPSMICYEELVKSLCTLRKYDVALNIIEDLEKSRRITTFIGNVILLHCMYSRHLCQAWVKTRDLNNVTSDNLLLGRLIGQFSDYVGVNEQIEDLEGLIKQVFKPDLYTYNMLLRRIADIDLNKASKEGIELIYENGFKPNRWSYDLLVKRYIKAGKSSEARKYMAKMFEKGFELS